MLHRVRAPSTRFPTRCQFKNSIRGQFEFFEFCTCRTRDVAKRRDRGDACAARAPRERTTGVDEQWTRARCFRAPLPSAESPFQRSRETRPRRFVEPAIIQRFKRTRRSNRIERASSTHRIAELLGQAIGELFNARRDLVERHGFFATVALDDVKASHRSRGVDF